MRKRVPLHESVGVWLGIGGLVVVLAAFPAAIGVAQTTTAHSDLISNPWIWAALVGEGIGVVALIWAVVLYLAHRHAQGHMCPDPAAHTLPTTQPERERPSNDNPPMQPTISAPPQQLRSALRQLHSDIGAAMDLIQRALDTGQYWGPSDRLPDGAWNKNHKQLSAIAEIDTATYEALNVAFQHVKRINAFQFPRWFTGRAVKPDDRLDDAMIALGKAEELVKLRLATFDDPTGAVKLRASEASASSDQLRRQLAASLDAVRDYKLEFNKIMGDPTNAEGRDLEGMVRAEIRSAAVVAFRPIKLTKDEQDAFEDMIFSACCQRGWEPPPAAINPVNPEHMELGWAWIEGAVTITSDDPGALRRLAEDRSRIAREIRDSKLGRELRESYSPKQQPFGILG